MKMLGITDLRQVHPGLVNTLGVDHLIPQPLESGPTTGLGQPKSRVKARL